MSDFFQWQDDGNLSLDVEVLETDGRVVTRRINLSRDRLATILSEDKAGIRFFMNHVIRKIRPGMRFNMSTLQKAVKAPDMAQKIFNQGDMAAEDLLPPQFLELEKQMVPSPSIPVYYFPVKV